MELSFTPTPDVAVILNALLDKFENRAKRSHSVSEIEETYHVTYYPEAKRSGRSTQHALRSIKISLTDLPLPSYFSQTDPEPRIVANKQLQELANYNFITLTWLPGEANHILQAASIANGTDHPGAQRSGRTTRHDALYRLLQRTPISDQRARLESLLLAEKFRYPKEDWRARALDYTLQQLCTGKSPSPFSLTDSNLNLDLIAVLQALPTLTAETPYRVFSVRVFNDTKRFDDLKSALVRLARRAHREWKSFSSEDLLREFNLVANPDYVHIAGNWKLNDRNGQIIHLDSFIPSVGFPASQITSLQKITIHAEWLLCIENLTSFHQEVDSYISKRINNGIYHPEAKRSERSTQHATLCLMGNPSPAIRHLLRLIPEEVPIYLWSDMDYGGFNILSQLRRQVSPRIRPYLMDPATFEKYAHLSRPLTQSDTRNLKRLLFNPTLEDSHPAIEYLLQRGLKLEQEAIHI